jgi:hypothetical protein
MALRFIDSFDHYDDAQVAQKWSSVSGAPLITTLAGRFGSGLNLLGGTSVRSVEKALDAQETWIVGVGMRWDSLDTDRQFMRIVDGSTVHIGLILDTGSRIAVQRSATTIATATTVMLPDVWYYIELKVTIADAGGVAQLRINGTQEVNFSGDTRNAGNASADRVFLQATSGSANADLHVDDVYICDGTGAAPTNDFLGDVRIEAILPNGNGTTSQFDGSDGNQVDNYLLVDEAVPDDDTTYVESGDIGDKDTYAYQNLTPTTGTVYGVQIVPRARKTDAGTRSIVSVARLSATEVDSADKALSTTYMYLPDVRETKPGGGAWTITDVNDAEFGVKVTA